MIHRQFITAFTSITLVLASLTGGVASWNRDSDVNGDTRADILDIQIVAAALMAGASEHAKADINHDGRVDILDFQRIVTDASDPAPAPRPTRTNEAPVVLDLPRIFLAGSAADYRPLPLAVLEELRAGADATVQPIREFPVVFREIRYVLGYSSHSPPAVA